MIEKFFSFDGWYYRTFSFLADLLILNILFLLTAWTVVFTGPAIIALYRGVQNLLQQKQTSVIREYFQNLQEVKRGSLLTAIVLAFGLGVAGVGFVFMSLSTALGFLVIVLTALSFLFVTIFTVIFSLSTLSVKEAGQEAFYVLLSSTAHGIVLFVIPAVVLFLLAKVNLMLCLVSGFAISVCLQVTFFNKVLVKTDGQ